MRLAPRWALPFRNPHLAAGDRLGKYRIVRRLAVGGMAEIFLARVEALRGFEKLVVVKRLLPQYVQNRNLVRMFLDEARLMATLNHPNITQVHDVGEARGSYFFAMEYVHGEDLRTILRVTGPRMVAMPIELAVGVIAEAAAGLQHAHEKQGNDGVPLAIVHRDVSPSNVLVSYDGAVKLTDFGVAKWARQEAHTRHGTLKGKCAYMSPEQCRGEPLDHRSDVFALGILLYELTTGTRLFQGASDFAILNQIVDGRIVPPGERRPGYPPALERIVMRALERPRDRRYGYARDLQLALEAFAHEQHLPLMPIVRARFMQDVFARKLAAWRAAATAGKSLGQYLASLPDGDVLGFEEPTNDGEDDSAAGRGTGTIPEGRAMSPPAAAPSMNGETPVLPPPGAPRALSPWSMALALVALTGIAGGVWWVSNNRTPATAGAPVSPGGTVGRTAGGPRDARVVVSRDAEPGLVRPLSAAPDSRELRSAGGRTTAGNKRPARAVVTRGVEARGDGAGDSKLRETSLRAGSVPPQPPATKTAETAAAAPAGERVKIWDPDSVLLPK